MSYEFLYHGTTKEYHDLVLEKFGRYKHLNGGNIYCTDNITLAAAWAMNRGEQFTQRPVILKVDMSKASKVLYIRDDIWPEAPFLEKEWYTVIESEKDPNSIESIV